MNARAYRKALTKNERKSTNRKTAHPRKRFLGLKSLASPIQWTEESPHQNLAGFDDSQCSIRGHLLAVDLKKSDDIQK
jgi:hypothetical protein